MIDGFLVVMICAFGDELAFKELRNLYMRFITVTGRFKKMISTKRNDKVEEEPIIASDHPVLEFLNTVSVFEGVLQDSLQTDADVLRTLTRLGWTISFNRTGLLAAARELREEVRHLIESRKSRHPLDLARLNEFLGAAKSHQQLRQNNKGSLWADRVWEDETPAQMLAPLAEAAAHLLEHGDFELIRRCENSNCVLWFYDRTKSHRRRWCSMASCGNRAKVSAFRKRRQQV